MRRDVAKTLAPLGITEVEYEAMVCPYYGTPLGLREMARDTVLENNPTCGAGPRPKHCADEYLAALEGMIAKGWLCIYEEDPGAEARFDAEGIPHSEFLLPEPGAVTFTRTGYFLHRRTMRLLHGLRRVQSVDSITVVDSARRTLSFYGASMGICREWARELTQHTGGGGLSGYGIPSRAEVVRVVGPERIGAWRASRFLRKRAGYRVTVHYRVPRRRRFDVPELGLTSWVECFRPVDISGTVQGERFTLHDRSYRRQDWHLDDTRALYRWRFRLGGAPVPAPAVPEAALTGDTEPVPGWGGGASYRFVREEDLTMGDRARMLTVAEAEAVVLACSREYLAQKECR